MLVAEKPFRGEQRSVLGEALAVHQQVLPVHVDLDVVDALRAKLVDHVERHPDVPHQDLHGRLGVLVLEEKRDAVLLATRRHVADAVHEPRPGLGVRCLEGIVVALDPGPQDHLRVDRSGEVRSTKGFGERGAANGVVRRRESSAAEQRIQMRAGRDGVDAVLSERRTHFVQVLLGELLRVVELVVVDEVVEPAYGARHLEGGRLAGMLGLISARHEPGHHRPERPYAK